MLFYSCDEGTFRYDFVYGIWAEMANIGQGKLTFGDEDEIFQVFEGNVY